MPESPITSIRIQPLTLPYHFPFATSKGQKLVTHNTLIQIQLKNGLKGCGEASTALAWPKETPLKMRRFAKQFKNKIIGKTIDEALKIVAQKWKSPQDHCAILNAFECALWDLKAKQSKKPLFRLFGNKNKSFETSFTISAWPSAQAAYVAHWAFKKGFRTLKIKVGTSNIFEDLKRVIAVSNVAPRASLILDANQGWDFHSAVLFIETCKQLKLKIILIEQPFHRKSVQEMKKFKNISYYPIAADESVKNVKDAKRIIKLKAADVLNLKLAKHGLTQALEIIHLAKRSKMKLMIGCMAESAIGQSAAVHLAAGTGAFQYADLDSHLLLKPTRLRGAFQTRGATLKAS